MRIEVFGNQALLHPLEPVGTQDLGKAQGVFDVERHPAVEHELHVLANELARPGDQVFFVADSGRFAAEAGWHPTVAWRDGLRDLAEWLSADLDLPAVRPSRIKRKASA